MIGKVMSSGKSFADTSKYLCGEEKQAEILAVDGVREDHAQMAKDFEFQASSNRRVKNPVSHHSLSFLQQDSEKLSNEKMTEIAMNYMAEMGITNTQFAIVRHNNTDHPHCHILFNRVNKNGKRINDSYEAFRMKAATKKLREKHSLSYNERKTQNIKTEKLRGGQKLRHEFYEPILACREKSKNINELMINLEDERTSLKRETPMKYKA